VRIEAAAEVTGAWTTTDPGVLGALDEFHVWTPEYLQTRCLCTHRSWMRRHFSLGIVCFAAATLRSYGRSAVCWMRGRLRLLGNA